MSENEREWKSDLEHRSRRMFSAAMYRRLKAIVDSWRHEERARARIAIGGFVGLLVWVLLVFVSVPLLGREAAYLVVFGFLAWVVFVVFLIRRHLGRRGERP